MLGKCQSKDPRHDIESTNFKKSADDTTYVCTVCNRVWEYELQSARISSKKTTLVFYTDIPKYKKKIKVCDYCEKNR